MSEVWETRDGMRRVRRDPPTLEEAVFAAQGLTDDLHEQAEIVASLMPIGAEEARSAVLRLRQRPDVGRITVSGRLSRQGGHGNAARAVVVERRVPRRFGAGH